MGLIVAIMNNLYVYRECKKNLFVLQTDLNLRFNTIDHSIQASKLEHYEVKGIGLMVMVNCMK